MILRTMTSPDRREMPGADRTLPTVRFLFDSGNYCDLTIGKKNIDGFECRIAVEFAWYHAPVGREDAEAWAVVRSMGLDRPDFHFDTPDEEISQRNTARWLTGGAKPEPVQ